MNIMIIGCGKVGQALTEQLSAEGDDITIVDIDEDKVRETADKYDVMGVIGNGATHSVQLEAGIENTDLMIAVTASDELNLLCCLMAKKAGKCQSIARIRNPEFNKDAPYLQEELGLAMVINPEFAAASEIARVIRFPSAMKIDIFAKGRMELLKFKMPENCVLENYAVKELTTKLKCDVLVCMIERDDEAIIPGGDMRFEKGDTISVVATPLNASRFFRKIGYHSNPTKNVIIAGGGALAFYLSTLLAKAGINVKIIEKNLDRCEELCVSLPDASIIHGDASDKETLLEEGLESTDAFVSLTNLDEENILLSLFAQEHMKGKIVTKVNRAEYDEIIHKLSLDSVVNPKQITAEYIVRFVRAMKNSMGSNVETLSSLSKGKVEAAEFHIREKSPIVGKTLQELKFKQNVLIAGIVRDGKMIIPRGQDEIHINDSVVVVSRHLGMHDISDILE